MLDVISDLAARYALPLNSPELLRSAIKTIRMLFLRGLTASIFGLKKVMSNNMDNVKETTKLNPPTHAAVKLGLKVDNCWLSCCIFSKPTISIA